MITFTNHLWPCKETLIVFPKSAGPFVAVGHLRCFALLWLNLLWRKWVAAAEASLKTSVFTMVVRLDVRHNVDNFQEHCVHLERQRVGSVRWKRFMANQCFDSWQLWKQSMKRNDFLSVNHAKQSIHMSVVEHSLSQQAVLSSWFQDTHLPKLTKDC